MILCSHIPPGSFWTSRQSSCAFCTFTLRDLGYAWRINDWRVLCLSEARVETQDRAGLCQYCPIPDLYLGQKAPSWGCVKLELEMFSVIKSRLGAEVLPWGDSFGYY